MGVDIQTYRAKIGTYRHSYGVDVVTISIVINFSKGLKTVGCVLFIGILLIIAGVEQNPGPRESESLTNQPTKIRVTGLPSGATEEHLAMCFKNENEQGGGKVREVVLVNQGNSAIVDFKDSSAVDKVMQKQPIIILGTTVNVEVFAEKTRPTRIKVTGIPESATKEFLIMFFENEHRQGGGPVIDVAIDIDNHVGFVEFQKPEAVEIVMRNKPIVILGKEVNIQVINDGNGPDETCDLQSDEDEGHDSDETCDLQSHEGRMESEGKIFHQVLQKLGLAEKYPSKITVQDVIAVDPNGAAGKDNKCISSTDIPWMMLRRLICAHGESRDMAASGENNAYKNKHLDESVSFLSDVPEDNHDISPLDIFTVLFQCCDPLLKQIFFQKLYLCKMAVPFLYKQWNTKEQHRPIISVWPLRSLVIENNPHSGSIQINSKEVDLLEFKTKVVAFARFGRPLHSKSKLLNSLLSSPGCKTFFNIDSPSGMNPRNLSNGNVEMFWLPTMGDKRDHFQHAMTFLNMRGDLNEHFNGKSRSFIAKFTDAVAIFIDKVSILKKTKEVKAVLLNFSSIILVIADPLRTDEIETIENSFQSFISNQDINFRLVSTHKGVLKLNEVEMVSHISLHIESHVKKSSTETLDQRLDFAITDTINSDEQEQNCKHGKREAEDLITQMKQDGESRRWKNLLTPVHGTYSKELGKLKKTRDREKDFKEGYCLDSQMKTVRQKQTQSITKSVKLFINVLLRNEMSPLITKFFVSWLHFYIEREKRNILPQLMYENQCAWKKLKTLKSKETEEPSDIKEQETEITKLEVKIDEASFSVDSFFREIGHIYEAILDLHEDPTNVELPSLHSIAKVIGNLVANGHEIELIDGDSFYMPYLWTQAVLTQVDKCIGSKNVMSLSVLGLQGSGKSTLLNTMFGTHFPTRTGRCTRGIHVKLIPVKSQNSEDMFSVFNYVLVADTEGLRSQELNNILHEHDNELATFITGIGDVTMMNIMGENISEVRDILQVIVHAFLRLKMANNNLDIRKSCVFIHQNVTDQSASENIMSGLGKLMQTLDEMTRESAQSECITNINTFNQVIEFDPHSQVMYLKNLWQGNPPMARVNNEYSEKVEDIMCNILQKAIQMKDKSYKSLSDFLEHAHCLWKGVLNEDFVFSFRNSLEIRSFIEMEKVVQNELWNLESFVCKHLVNCTKNKFSSCDQKGDLQNVAKKLADDMSSVLYKRKSITEQKIKTYFETNKYKEILVQWMQIPHNRLDLLCLKLKKIFEVKIEKCQRKRSVEIFMVANHEKHEEELNRMSMEVATKQRENTLNKKQIDALFADIWQSFLSKIDTSLYLSEQNRGEMKCTFIQCLNDIFIEHHALLDTALRNTSYLEPIPGMKKLSGSFQDIGIDKADINLTLIQRGQTIVLNTKAEKVIANEMNSILAAIDEKIHMICQVDDEITDIMIKEFLRGLDSSLKKYSSGHKPYNFQKMFYVKLYVHVSRYTHNLFEIHNENYFRTRGIAVRIEQYRVQQKISFEAHLSNRQSEDIAARLFCNIIENVAEESASEHLPNKVIDDLYTFLPHSKEEVILAICMDLLQSDKFGKFMAYIQFPSEHAGYWITEKVYTHLFGETRAYNKHAAELLKIEFQKVYECVQTLKKEYYSKQKLDSTEIWINDLKMLLEVKDIIISREMFWILKKEVNQIKNFEHLTDTILHKLPESEKMVNANFRQHERESVKWANNNPVDKIIKWLWGCSEQCVFCGEPCVKNADHKGSPHYSIQHRPACCNGTSRYETYEASLESCEFKIQSDSKHTCKAFNFKCNNGISVPCNDKWHDYRRYRKYVPDWDIPPTSNMDYTSKFWMWFVATYKKQLHDYYEFEVDNIPSTWDSITKDEAKKSLFKAYSASKCLNM